MTIEEPTHEMARKKLRLESLVGAMPTGIHKGNYRQILPECVSYSCVLNRLYPSSCDREHSQLRESFNKTIDLTSRDQFALRLSTGLSRSRYISITLNLGLQHFKLDTSFTPMVRSCLIQERDKVSRQPKLEF